MLYEYISRPKTEVKSPEAQELCKHDSVIVFHGNL